MPLPALSECSSRSLDLHGQNPKFLNPYGIVVVPLTTLKLPLKEPPHIGEPIDWPLADGRLREASSSEYPFRFQALLCRFWFSFWGFGFEDWGSGFRIQTPSVWVEGFVV